MHRFAPVKTCSDLFVLRSDAYVITEASTVEPAVPEVPLIKLDDAHYKLVDKMEALTHTTPSLAKVSGLVGHVAWHLHLNTIELQEGRADTPHPRWQM